MLRLCDSLRCHFYKIRPIGITRSLNTQEDKLKSWHDIPGPSTLPLIGPLHHLLPGGSLFQSVRKNKLTQTLYKTYGPIVKIDKLVVMDPIVIVFDPESASQVWRGENILPMRTALKSLQYYRQNLKGENKSYGLLSDQGEAWKKIRSMVNPVLLHPATIKLYGSSVDEVAYEVIERVRAIKDDEYKLQNNFGKEITLWAIESLGTVALGRRMGYLSDLPEDSLEMNLLYCVEGIMKALYDLDIKPSLWKYMSTPTFRKVMKLYEKQERISKHFIDKSIEEIKSKPKSDDEKGVLEKLMEIDEEIAYTMATEMLMAGIDSTANAMLAALYLLAANPEKQHKLREKLKSGDENNAYLKGCLKESMRMMPIASMNMRFTTKEYNLLGYLIPKGMSVAFAHHDMSMMERHYPRPTEYIPERWLADSSDPFSYKNAHPYTTSPFGFGSRSCIGRRIAELNLETFLTRFIENFHFEWKGPPPQIEQTAMNYVRGPYTFTINNVKT